MFEIGNLIRVELASANGDVARFEFEEMPYNEFLMLQAGANATDKSAMIDLFGNLVNYCTKVEGVIFAHSGTELTLERLRAKTIPTSFMFALCNAYIKAMTDRLKGTADPKKESAESAS